MKFPPLSKKASRSLKLSCLVMLPIPNLSHLSPMLMAPRARGETWTPAVGDSFLYRPKGVLGLEAGFMKSDIATTGKGRLFEFVHQVEEVFIATHHPQSQTKFRDIIINRSEMSRFILEE